MSKPKELYYEKRGNVLVKNLNSRHFEAYYCKDKAQALEKALEIIPGGASVGWGGAKSASEIGLLDAVRNGNYRALDRETCATPEERERMARQVRNCLTYPAILLLLMLVITYSDLTKLFG